jgi:thioredoxin 1
VVVAVAAVLIAKNAGKKPVPDGAPAAGETPAIEVSGAAGALPAAATQGKPIPRLVDLGAGKCIPCQMMAPILEDLKKTYVGRLDVQFIDVWEKPEAGKEYGINVIPTQIFYDATGKELFRHEGFFAKEDILAKWKEFGVDLAK